MEGSFWTNMLKFMFWNWISFANAKKLFTNGLDAELPDVCMYVSCHPVLIRLWSILMVILSGGLRRPLNRELLQKIFWSAIHKPFKSPLSRMLRRDPPSFLQPPVPLFQRLPRPSGAPQVKIAFAPSVPNRDSPLSSLIRINRDFLLSKSVLQALIMYHPLLLCLTPS